MLFQFYEACIREWNQNNRIISTGVYAFPVELAAKVAVHIVNRFLQDNSDNFDLVEWGLFDSHTEAVYEAEVDRLYKMI